MILPFALLHPFSAKALLKWEILLKVQVLLQKTWMVLKDVSNKLQHDAHAAGPPKDHALNRKSLHNFQRDLFKT